MRSMRQLYSETENKGRGFQISAAYGSLGLPSKNRAWKFEKCGLIYASLFHSRNQKIMLKTI